LKIFCKLLLGNVIHDTMFIDLIFSIALKLTSIPNLKEMCELLWTQGKTSLRLFPPDVMNRLQHNSLYSSPFVLKFCHRCLC